MLCERKSQWFKISLSNSTVYYIRSIYCSFSCDQLVSAVSRSLWGRLRPLLCISSNNQTMSKFGLVCAKGIYEKYCMSDSSVIRLKGSEICCKELSF